MDITKIPSHELIDDRAASLIDIRVCEVALLHHIKEYSGGSVADRLRINQAIVAVIDIELARREKESAL